MKYLFPLLLILLVGFASCKKEPIEEPEKLYDIYVKDFNLKITEINKTIGFDINDDGEFDCNYSSRVYSNGFDSAGYLVVNVFDSRYFSGSDSTVEVTMYLDSLDNKLFKIHDIINEDGKWLRSNKLYYKRYWKHYGGNITIEIWDFPYYENSGIGYVAIRRRIGDDFYYGWLRLGVQDDIFTIYSSAFNRIPNVPIQIGQKE